MRVLVKNLNRTIRLAKQAERTKDVNSNYRGASFLLRMIAEGRPIHDHIPKSKERRVAVAKVLAEIAVKGVVLQNKRGTHHRQTLCLTSDIVRDLYELFWDDVTSSASVVSARQFNRDFQIAIARAIY